jgi:hypothetical protein
VLQSGAYVSSSDKKVSCSSSSTALQLAFSLCLEVCVLLLLLLLLLVLLLVSISTLHGMAAVQCRQNRCCWMLEPPKGCPSFSYWNLQVHRQQHPAWKNARVIGSSSKEYCHRCGAERLYVAGAGV